MSNVRVNLIWNASSSRQPFTQIVKAIISAPDGSERSLTQKVQVDRGSSMPLIVAQGSEVKWWVETSDRGGHVQLSDPHQFTADGNLPPAPALNLSVDLVSVKDPGMPSGEMTRPATKNSTAKKESNSSEPAKTEPAKSEPATAPVVTSQANKGQTQPKK
jgi:hypothetical protein